MNSDADLALHMRLAARDPVAPHDCVVRWLPDLINWLSARFASVASRDMHLIESAALDALFDYTRNPHKYDPGKSSICTYLRMSAHRDLLNTLKRYRTQSRNAISLEFVEDYHPDGNNDIEEQVVRRVDAQVIIDRIRKIFSDPVDQRLICLILMGERSTDVYAKVLGIQHLPSLEQQKRIVKQHKDRINKRLERLGDLIWPEKGK
jgi:RNA polymerase sigma-70 factor (ECF subfamily)